MQIVDPNAPRPKRRRTKKEPLPTPSQYDSQYSHMSCSLAGGMYYPRAKDKGAIYAKHMKEAIKRRDDYRPARAVIFSKPQGHNAWQKRHIFGAAQMYDNEILDLPSGAFITSEQDLERITKMADDQRGEANIERLGDRIGSILGMLGGAEPLDPNVAQTRSRYSQRARGWKVNGYTLVLLEGREGE